MNKLLLGWCILQLLKTFVLESEASEQNIY